MKIREIISATAGFRGKIALSTGAGMVRVVADLLFVALSKRTVDIATGYTQGQLVPCICALIGIIILELVCHAVAARATELTEAAMKNELQKRLFRRLLSAEFRGREKFHSGDIMSRLTDDCRIVAENLCRSIPAMLVAAVQLGAAFMFLWYFSPSLAVTLFMLMPACILAGKVFYRRVRRLSADIRDVESRLQETMQESLQHRMLLLAYRRVAQAAKTVAALHRTRYSRVRRRTNITVCSRTAVTAGFEAGYLAAFIWGVTGLRNGTVSFGLMTAYLQLAGQIQRPLAELARLIPSFVQSGAAFSRIESLEQLPAEPECDEETPVCGTGESAGIVFREVTFGYPGKDNRLFERFSHTFAPGSHTAITGETGAGKSTLLRLILGLYRPQEGQIEMIVNRNGENHRIPVSAATRDHIIYVPQGNSLLSGTIRQNLSLANPEASDQEMREALHIAAADFVLDLNEGLDTPCGERGDGLSEGQAQRIAIARGLLCPGTIMLLDEISASLDESTEALILTRLFEKYPERTILLVTHRAPAAARCDSVLHI